MSSIFHTAAARVLSAHHSRLPDLSGLVVLVPNRYAMAPFLAALRDQISAPVFLPPRFSTLAELADGIEGVRTRQPDSLRLIELHRFLSRIDWLDDAARWPMAEDMLTLLNEMDVALLTPPVDYPDFARQIERAARRALSAPLAMEARLLFEVWRAFQGGSAGGGGEYAWRLSNWLRQASGPVYSLGLSGLNRLEQQFIDQCGRQLGLEALPVETRYPARRQFLAAAWRRAGAGEKASDKANDKVNEQEGEKAEPGSVIQAMADSAASLRERAAAFAAVVTSSPLEGAVWLQAADDLEGEAGLVASWLQRQLAEGRRAIGVVALDRMAARRLRAMLDRHGILLHDEAGWTFSTASVSHVLDRWLALLLDGFYHRDLLDLLKSPFVFADLPDASRQEAVASLDRAIRAEGVVEGLERFQALARLRAVEALPLLQRVEMAARRFRQPRRRSLAGWLEALFEALDLLGARAAFLNDQAGEQLLERLRRLAGEIAADGGLHGLAGWRTWLNMQLDRETFRESDIESPLRLTHLGALQLREFDALVVLGADATHLPETRDDAFFNDALRAELGLPGRHARGAEKLANLTEAISRAERVLITWQARRGVDPNPPSPWMTILETFHRLAYGRGLGLDMGLCWPDDLPRPVEARPPYSPPTMPAPRLPALPARLSASAWQDLVSCPYRWFARRGLGLAEEEAVAEDMEKADYGELVHALLARFHVRHPVLMTVARSVLEESLASLAKDQFAPREAGVYLARGWRMRWERQSSAYLDWALDWEAAGHVWRESEKSYASELVVDRGGLAGAVSADAVAVTLHGRLDRVDAGPAGAAVLDYKTQPRQVLLRKTRDPGENVQLPFYGLLTGAAEAMLVGLDDDKVTAIGLRQSLAEAASAERDRLVATLSAIVRGAALPAHGAADVCERCEIRGLCRRDWYEVVRAGIAPIGGLSGADAGAQ